MKTADSLSRPPAGTYPVYFENYLRYIGEEADPLAMLSVQPTALHQLLAALTDEQASLRYAPNKWSIKQLLLHVADTERIFAYRALAFSRGETQSLPGFDENAYVDHCAADRRSLASLLDEYASIRQATLSLFRSLTSEQLDHLGQANGQPVTPRSLVFVTAGHEAHHAAILTERYLPLLTAE